MERITGATVEPDLHGAGKDGFREGAPGSSPATILTEAWFNSVQEEICTVIEKGGTTLNVSSNEQLYNGVINAAGLRYIGGAISSHVSRTGPAAADYSGLAYGDSDFIFVAVADGLIHSSPDGVTWTDRPGVFPQFHDVCWSSGRFLLVGESGALITSENGTSFTARTNDGGFADEFYCCTGGGTYWIAAGRSGEIQSSTTATSGWTHQAAAAGVSSGGAFFGVAYGSGVYVVVGGDSPNEPLIQTSSNADITTWTARTPSELTGALYDVAYGGGAFVAVGEGPGTGEALIMRSTDLGATWSTIDAPNDIAVGLSCVVYNSSYGFFLACGSGGKIIISRDGSNGSWRDLSRDSFSSYLDAIAFGDGTCVMVGNSSVIRQSLAFPWME